MCSSCRSAVCRDTGPAQRLLQRAVGGGDGLPQLEGLAVVHGDARPLHEQLAQEFGARRAVGGGAQGLVESLDRELALAAQADEARQGSGGFAGGGQRPWPARAGRTGISSSCCSRDNCSTAVAMAWTSRPTENTSMSWPSCSTSTISRSERTQRTREPAMRRWADMGVAAPGIEAAQGLHRLLDAHQPEPGRAQARGHAEPDEIDERVAPGRAVSVGARERRGQEPAAIPVVELARGEVGEAGGAGSREPRFEDVTLEFHACILHPRNRCRVPLVDGDRCKGETLAGS